MIPATAPKLTEQEQRAEATELKALQAITEPSQAPEGSQLRTMADAAKAAGDERDGLEHRVASLRERLDGVTQREAAAASLDDFSSAAVARAENIVLSERLSETEARLAPVTKAAESAESDLAHVWGNIRRCIGLLEQQARSGYGQPGEAGVERKAACQQCLTALLTPGVPLSFRGWWNRTR
jgi:hypothetical protein